MNLNNIKKSVLLLIIIIIGGALRFYQLGAVPVSVDWDEAALGYNAYSIMQTGRDEYGEFMPVVLKSFGDYKPALYSYLAIPGIKIFGLNAFSIRLPSAIFGLLMVWATYFLVHELFKRETTQNQTQNYAELLALVSALLLAVSPWHIQFSRTGFEANIGLALNMFTVLLFVKAFKRPILLPFSAAFSALSIYSYQSEKIFVPVLVAALVLIYRKEIFRLPKKYIISSLIVGVIVISPMILYLVSNNDALSRARGSLLTANQTTLLKDNIIRIEVDIEQKDYLGLVFDNRRVLYLRSAFVGYFSHFDLNWLFVSGDSARHHAPGVGLLYLWEFPFLFIGFYALLFSRYFTKENKKGKLLLFSWFLLAPVPAAFTNDVPHAVRTLNFLPTFQVFTAIGILTAVKTVLSIKPARNAFAGSASEAGGYKVLSIKPLYLLLITYLMFIFFNISYYIDQYFVQQNYYYSKYWQYGREEEIKFVKSIESNYDKIVVSDKDFLDQSYIFYLYYLKYNPEFYQEEGRIFSDGERNIRTFGKYEFRSFEWGEELENDKVLYVGGPREFGDGANILREINYLNGEEAVKIVGGKHE